MRNLTPDNVFVSPEERTVFEKLSASLGNEWAGAHNLKIFRSDSTPGQLCPHCEIDLLLCHPDCGIFVGEVKGGKGDGSVRQLRRSGAALKAILKERFPWFESGDFLHAFACFPNQKRGKNSAKGRIVPAMFADDLASGAELFLLRLPLRKNAVPAGTEMASLLAKNPQGLSLPAKKFGTRLRERLRKIFLHMAWLLRDRGAPPTPSEMCAPGVPAEKFSPSTEIAELVRKKESPGRIAHVQKLLVGGESANVCDQNRQSLLSIAVKNGNKTLAEMIFRAGGIVMPASAKRISKAFSLFDDELLAEMISRDALSDSAADLPGMVRTSYLRGFIRAFRALMKKYPREVLLSTNVNSGPAGAFPLVHSAAFLKTPDFLLALAELSFPLDSKDDKGRTPLQVAREFGREESVRVLTDALFPPAPEPPVSAPPRE